jgi:DNA-binding beta-propeller fold protein YncE
MHLTALFALAAAAGAVAFAAAQTTAQTTGQLLVVAKGAQSLSILDPGKDKISGSVSEGKLPGRDTGHEVAASRDGKLAFVPIYGDSGVGKPGSNGQTMVVINIASQKIVDTVDFGHPVRPHLPVLGPPVAGHPDGLLYVTTELDKTVSIVDPKTLKILGTVPTGSVESHMLAVAHNGKYGYTANVGPGTVSVLDLLARKTLKILPVSGQVQRISISPDDKWVFTSDQTKPQLAVIDTATNSLSKWVPLPSTGYGTAPTPDGKLLLVAMMNIDKVAVVDLKSFTVVRTIDVPPTPQAVLVEPDGKVAYVSCDKSGEVAEIDLATWKVKRLVPTGKVTDGLAWAR